MSEFRSLTDAYSVAPQIALEDVAAAKDQGFALIINNRPDGEEPSAPQGDAMAAACAAVGMAYAAVPISHSGFSHAQLDAFDKLISSATGPVLAYCRSGTRSTHLWALAQARAGGDLDAIANAASKGGYDLSGLMPMMEALAGGK